MTAELRIQNNITLICDLIADYTNFSPDNHLIRSKLRDVFKERALQIQFPTPCKVFWQLKEKWWMQFFDGKLHHLGPQVFDQGLHDKRSTEPGYYRSMENAATYASQHIFLSPSIPFYKMLHRTACNHFDGWKTNTEVTSEHTGLFTPINFPIKRCIGKAKFLYDHCPEYAEIVDKNIQKESLFSCCKSEYPNDIEGRKKILEPHGITEEEFLAWRSKNASCWKMKEQIEKK